MGSSLTQKTVLGCQADQTALTLRTTWNADRVANQSELAQTNTGTWLLGTTGIVYGWGMDTKTGNWIYTPLDSKTGILKSAR